MNGLLIIDELNFDFRRIRPGGLRYGVGVDSAWEQKKLEATLREMLAVLLLRKMKFQKDR